MESNWRTWIAEFGLEGLGLTMFSRNTNSATGGEGGIRTPTVNRWVHFETDALGQFQVNFFVNIARNFKYPFGLPVHPDH